MPPSKAQQPRKITTLRNFQLAFFKLCTRIVGGVIWASDLWGSSQIGSSGNVGLVDRQNRGAQSLARCSGKKVRTSKKPFSANGLSGWGGRGHAKIASCRDVAWTCVTGGEARKLEGEKVLNKSKHCSCADDVVAQSPSGNKVRGSVGLFLGATGSTVGDKEKGGKVKKRGGSRFMEQERTRIYNDVRFVKEPRTLQACKRSQNRPG